MKLFNKKAPESDNKKELLFSFFAQYGALMEEDKSVIIRTQYALLESVVSAGEIVGYSEDPTALIEITTRHNWWMFKEKDIRRMKYNYPITTELKSGYGIDAFKHFDKCISHPLNRKRAYLVDGNIYFKAMDGEKIELLV